MTHEESNAVLTREEKPYMWVIEHPARFDHQYGGEPESTEFLWEPKDGAFPLYRHSVTGQTREPYTKADELRDTYESIVACKTLDDFKAVQMTVLAIRALPT
jgi:hypothetical protein